MKNNLTVLQNFIIGDQRRMNHFLSTKGISCTAKVLGDVEWIVNYKRNDQYYPTVKQKYNELLPYWKEVRILEDNDFTWAKSTLALLEHVNTPYVFYLIEDRMFYQTTKGEMETIVQELADNDIGFLFIGKISKYGLSRHPEWVKVNNFPAYEMESENLWIFRSKNAPLRVLSNDAIYRVDVLKKSLERIIEKRDKIPRILEMEFNWLINGWPELKQAVPKNYIIVSDDDPGHELGV